MPSVQKTYSGIAPNAVPSLMALVALFITTISPVPMAFTPCEGKKNGLSTSLVYM